MPAQTLAGDIMKKSVKSIITAISCLSLAYLFYLAGFSKGIQFWEKHLNELDARNGETDKADKTETTDASEADDITNKSFPDWNVKIYKPKKNKNGTWSALAYFYNKPFKRATTRTFNAATANWATRKAKEFVDQFYADEDVLNNILNIIQNKKDEIADASEQAVPEQNTDAGNTGNAVDDNLSDIFPKKEPAIIFGEKKKEILPETDTKKPDIKQDTVSESTEETSSPSSSDVFDEVFSVDSMPSDIDTVHNDVFPEIGSYAQTDQPSQMSLLEEKPEKAEEKKPKKLRILQQEDVKWGVYVTVNILKKEYSLSVAMVKRILENENVEAKYLVNGDYGNTYPIYNRKEAYDAIKKYDKEIQSIAT